MIDLVTDARIRILEKKIADLEGQVQSLREEVEKQHTVMHVNVSPSTDDMLLKAVKRHGKNV